MYHMCLYLNITYLIIHVYTDVGYNYVFIWSVRYSSPEQGFWRYFTDMLNQKFSTGGHNTLFSLMVICRLTSFTGKNSFEIHIRKPRLISISKDFLLKNEVRRAYYHT